MQATGVTAFAHFDEYLRQQRLEAFVEKFKNSVFHRTYYSYEDEDLNSELWEWDEIEEEEEEESQEVDQGTQCLKIPEKVSFQHGERSELRLYFDEHGLEMKKLKNSNATFGVIFKHCAGY